MAGKNKMMARHLIEGCGTIVAALGLLLVVTPFVFGYWKGGGMTTANVVVGALLFMFGAFRALLAYDARMIAVINIFLGVLAAATPWLMNAMFIKSFLMVHFVVGFGVIGVELIGLIVSQTNRRIAETDYM